MVAMIPNRIWISVDSRVAVNEYRDTNGTTDDLISSISHFLYRQDWCFDTKDGTVGQPSHFLGIEIFVYVLHGYTSCEDDTIIYVSH